jgi:hypothetical protein
MVGIINSNETLRSLSSGGNHGGTGGGTGGFFSIYSSQVGATKGDDDEDTGKGAFFKKICSLCNVQFPKDAISSHVLYKHIIDLRRRWDPSLVSDKVQLLEQNMSMYNLVPVCVFCAQYFDPDFPDGIAMPIRKAAPGKRTLFDVLRTSEDTQSSDFESIGGQSLSEESSIVSRCSTAQSGSRPNSRLGSSPPVSPSMRLNSPKALNLSKRGTVLTPVRITRPSQNRSKVHLVPGMDTRFEIGNNIERLGSPEVQQRRDQARGLVNLCLERERNIAAAEALTLQRISTPGIMSAKAGAAAPR